MAKQGEIDYIVNLGEAGMDHALNKPYSDPGCGRYFMDMGSIFSLLPQPPAKLLDLGVGSGWTSVMFARKGYEVVGQDIAPAMIELAMQNRERAKLSNLNFLVSDYESLDMKEQFDCAIFYDSLHHAVDEQAALSGAYKALKPGGLCITLEPGEGHHLAPISQNAIHAYGVTEKDMPPHHIIRMGRHAGFNHSKVYRRCFEPPLLFDSQLSLPMNRLRRIQAGMISAARVVWHNIKPSSSHDPTLAASNIVILYK
ncbi:MAG: class I SAM-dependent methyltransferase [Methylococcaceae bacterium]|nr:class I SAM-dependent methyltransferase [Methylococcaceae bacterium]